MIYSHQIKHNIDPNKEDPKTSTILGTLLAYPDTEIWTILYNAISEKKQLMKDVGSLKYYEFWPKWDKEGTLNSSYVEPDLFLSFDKLDVIIEAKRSENNGQYEDEWWRELRYYHNEYNPKVNPILISVGGNSNSKIEELDIDQFGIHKVYKCSWLSLLLSVMEKREQFSREHQSHFVRLSDMLIMGFNMHNVMFFKWMDSIVFRDIRPDSFSVINGFFKSKKNRINWYSPLFNKPIQVNSIHKLQKYFNE